MITTAAKEFKDYSVKSTIRELVSKAIEDPEIIKGLQVINVGLESIMYELEKTNKYLAVAEREISQHEWSVRELEVEREIFECHQSARLIRNIFLACLILTPIYYYAKVYRHLVIDISLGLLLVILGGIWVYRLLLLLKIQHEGAEVFSIPRFNIVSFLVHVIVKPNTGSRRELLESKKKAILNLEKRIDLALVEGSMKEIIRAYINSHIESSYNTIFKDISSSGLAQMVNVDNTINTNAIDRLDFLLNNMPGGSIGISGPRGAGKSTLIEHYCGRNKDRLVRGKPTISLMVTAPVEYSGRDFILHLFGTFCKRLLGINEASEDYKASLINSFNQDLLLKKTVYRVPTPLKLLCLMMGSFLMGLSFVNVLHKVPATLNVSKSPTLVTLHDSLGTKQSKDTMLKSNNEPTDLNLVWVIQKISGVEDYPVLMFWIGISLVSIFMITSVVQIRNRNDNRNDYNREEIEYHIADKARRWLKEILFQRSFTSGWSGAIKLPIGFEGNMNKGESLGYRQMSNPEIVAAFVDLINEVAVKTTIIIGIDELDKIESDDAAQKFLNEIKAIFGNPGCFFLVSVSENAMSQFERRGLPVRDTFDSSFDAILYVDYLSFSMARKLLQRRVIGLPVPFFSLCYCLSGGLARDLIRTFRLMLELNNGAEKTLSELTELIVEEDMRAKLRACRIVLMKGENDQLGRDILNIMRDMEVEKFTKTIITSSIAKLEVLAITSEQSELNGIVKASLKAKNELIAYLYFIDTLLHFFTDTLAKSSLVEAESNGDIERLAHSRQSIAIDPGICVRQIHAFRGQHTSISWSMLSELQ